MMELSLDVTDPRYSEAQAPDPDSYPALQGGQGHAGGRGRRLSARGGGLQQLLRGQAESIVLHFIV